MPAKAPVIANFRAAAERTLNRPGLSWGHNTVAAGNRQAFAEALEVWGSRFGTYNIEEFYVLADLHERLHLGPITADYKGSLAHAVRYLIAKTLDSEMGKAPNDDYYHFVRLVWAHAAEKSANVAVLSLNWDIALDNAVDRVFQRPALNPGITLFREYVEEQVGERPFNVFKLHGSMNWWVCSTCGVLWYDAFEKSAPMYWEGDTPRKCGECDTTLTPAMVPPMSQKFESGILAPHLERIWCKARDALQTCNWLTIAGYSFPPTDVQFRMFVADALAANPHLEGVTVVTSRKIGQAKLAFEQSYSQLVGALPDSVEVRFRYEGFARWVARDLGH